MVLAAMLRESEPDLNESLKSLKTALNDLKNIDYLLYLSLDWLSGMEIMLENGAEPTLSMISDAIRLDLIEAVKVLLKWNCPLSLSLIADCKSVDMEIILTKELASGRAQLESTPSCPFFCYYQDRRDLIGRPPDE
ncbi:hypothetical protein BDW59DRAFT_18889 [Aspergillus cavernicola]|uniref:Ankyrin repeat-containing domain protein n=1 Tax=Aspergillus cavernicola TaxID=176166 RepID=A0ABR4IS35_9EURO